jgi:hypothetical protein
MLLTSILFSAGGNLESASTIELTPAGDSIMAIAELPDGSRISSLLKAKGRCTATERQFIAPNDGGGVNRDGALGFSRSSIRLMRTADGSLVVEQATFGAGIMLIVPVAGYARNWSIFEQSR